MNTLEELLYYCKEPEPVGALLSTGEWGCGKTYLTEPVLKDKLKDKAFVLRISLFGLSSSEEIHATVKQAWKELHLQIGLLLWKLASIIPLTFYQYPLYTLFISWNPINKTAH